MIDLCPCQKADLDFLVGYVAKNVRPFPSILLLGVDGSGKRTLAQAAAEAVGLPFIEIAVDGNPQAIRDVLFGNPEQAESADRRGMPPGEIGKCSQGAIYLSHLEKMDPVLLQELHILISRRCYMDRLGNDWRVSDDHLLIGGFNVATGNPTIHSEHWLCSAFDLRIPVNPPSSTSELKQVSRNVLARISSKLVLSEDVDSVITSMSNSSANLISLRRWIETAARLAGPAAVVRGGHLRTAMARDLDWLLSKTPFRGYVLRPQDVDAWLKQFPGELQSLAAHLVRQICEKYYIGVRDYHDGLMEVIKRSGIPRGGEIIFCKWQRTGESSERISNVIKNQAGWKIRSELDLREQSCSFPAEAIKPVKWIVLADDFVGSGRTITSLFSSFQNTLPQVLRLNPQLVVCILILAGFEDGLRWLREKTRQWRNRVRIVVARNLYNRDRCFHPNSEVIPQASEQQRFREFCIQMARQQMPRLPKEFWLGYNETSCLVTFFDSVPNNTIPVVWYCQGVWKPLFPRSGLPLIGAEPNRDAALTA